MDGSCIAAEALQAAAVLGELPHPALPQISESVSKNKENDRGKLIDEVVIVPCMVLPTAVLMRQSLSINIFINNR